MKIYKITEVFKRMANTIQFQIWRRMKSREILNNISIEDHLNKLVDDSMKEENLKIEYGPFDNLTEFDD